MIPVRFCDFSSPLDDVFMVFQGSGLTRTFLGTGRLAYSR